MRALICDPGGVFTLGQIDPGLVDLQAAVGGFVQLVYLPGDLVLILNENGKLEHLALNRVATQLLAPALLPGDYLVGRVLLTGTDELGEFTDVPDDIDPQNPLGDPRTW